MVKLCLMASHGYPPGPGLLLHQDRNGVLKVCQPYLPSQIGKEEITRATSLSLRPHQCDEPWSPVSGFCESNKIVSTITKPVLIDVQGSCPYLVNLSFGLAEQCTRPEKSLQFLLSRSSELQREALDLSLLPNLMDHEQLPFDVLQQPITLVYPSAEFDAEKPLVDYVGDMACSSKIIVHRDGRVLFSGEGAEMKDLLSIVAEFYLAKKSEKWRTSSTLIPQFGRFDTSELQANMTSSLKVLDATVAPSKSPEKIKVKTHSKKKNGKKAGRERDLYKRSHFHTCESLLSLMMDKKQHGKNAILSLMKSSPELPELLTQFSASIAGTGLAVLFSVVCKVACGRAPFCASKLFNTGLGFGLVWLSWAVNKLRDNMIHVCKNANKVGMKDEEIINKVDESLKEIYFRAATLTAAAVLKLA